jgi:transcriptional/translational regulatory protein YebC/TACO1
MVKVSENDANSIVKLLELLEDNEDVQKIYSNFEVE